MNIFAPRSMEKGDEEKILKLVVKVQAEMGREEQVKDFNFKNILVFSPSKGVFVVEPVKI